MENRRKLIKYLLPALSLIFVLSCEYKVPVKEIITAKTAIEEAKKYDAETYAPEEIKKAEDLLLQSHDLVLSEKTDDAKKAAEDAIAAAREAEEKSLPPYSADKMKKADDAFAEADLVYAEKFSPEKFTEAGKLNAEAKTLNDSSEFKKSAELSIKSHQLSVEAKNESMQNSSVIEKQVATVESKLSELKRDKFSDAAEGNLITAGTSISKAKEGVNKRDYKSSLKEIEIARQELDAAAVLIRKENVSSSIQDLRDEVRQIREQNGSENIKQELDNAGLELDRAEASLEQNNITDAEIRVEQAEKLIAESNNKMKKINALAALEKAEKLLQQAKEKDADSKYSENLDKAESVIADGKSAVESGKFSDGLNSADEAEAIINTVLNSMEDDAAALAVKSEEGGHDESATDETVVEEETVVEPEKDKTGTTYVVKWRKQNTDCLWRISEKVYKDASFWPAIYLANRDQIKDPDLIFPGQRFVIPPKPQKRISYKEAKEQIKEKSK